MAKTPRIVDVSPQIQGLQTQITAIQPQISAMQSQVSNLQSQVPLLEDIKDFQWIDVQTIRLPASSIRIGSTVYTAADINWSFANGTGDNGLDTGAEAASQWYALYAVPNSTNTAYILKATTRHPISAPGPSGYSNYRYLGLFRNGQYYNSNTTDIAQFFKVGPIIQFWNASNGNATGIRYDGSSGPVTSVSTSFATVYAMGDGTGRTLPFNGTRYIWTLTQVPSGGSTAIASLTSKFWNGSFAMTGTVTMAAGNSGGPNAGYSEIWCDSTNVTQVATATTLALTAGQMNWSLNLAGFFDPLLIK